MELEWNCDVGQDLVVSFPHETSTSAHDLTYSEPKEALTTFSTDADVNVDLSSESRGTGSGNSIFEATRDVTVSFGSVLLTKATP